MGTKALPIECVMVGEGGQRTVQGGGFYALDTGIATTPGNCPVVDDTTTYDDADHPGSAGDNIEVLSAEVGDTTQTVTVVGINMDGRRDSETLSLNGTNVVAGTKKWQYIEHAILSAVTAGDVTIQAGTDNNDIYVIAANSFRTGAAHIYTGEYDFAVTEFSASLGGETDAVVDAGNVFLKLVYFTSAALSTDAPGNIAKAITIDSINLLDTEGVVNEQKLFGPLYPIIPAGSYAFVQAFSEANTADVSVSVRGFFING